MSTITRRRFLALSIKSIVISKFFISNVYPLNNGGIHSNGIKSNVVMLEGQGCINHIDRGINSIGGLTKFINKGDTVAIKPNMSFAKGPEFAVNTNPEVVGKVVKLLFAAGADKVYVIDNTLADMRMAYQISGIAKKAVESGAEVVFPLSRYFEEAQINGKFIKKWEIFRFFLEADKIINMPVAKHHGSALLTSAMKNWIGAIGGQRNKVHQKLDTSIYELASFFKPTLNIVDCTRILTKNGPSGGSLNDVRVLNKILISTDQVAVDTIAADLLGFNCSNIDYLRIGHNNKLGTMYKKDISLLKLNA
ncbi:MAG: DUF362 domain-containing protein [Deferribacterota bacterium]|nr:DUF362 domain-containing protein [Deferribacterota bacterium]